MSVLDVSERRAYLDSPYFKKHEFGDFTAFYIVVAICTVIAFVIIIINVVLGCCSRYSTYWNDRHTGNRWIASLWTATPHNQPALDYHDIDTRFVPDKVTVHPQQQRPLPRDVTEYSDLGYVAAESSSRGPYRDEHDSLETPYHEHQAGDLELQPRKESDI